MHIALTIILALLLDNIVYNLIPHSIGIYEDWRKIYKKELYMAFLKGANVNLTYLLSKMGLLHLERLYRTLE